MAENRFKKGLEKSKENTDNVQKEKEESKAAETTLDNEVSDSSDPITNLSKADIKAILKQTQKPKSKTHSLYLDDDVFEKLQKHAKSNKTSVSKVLNDLLKSIL